MGLNDSRFFGLGEKGWGGKGGVLAGAGGLCPTDPPFLRLQLICSCCFLSVCRRRQIRVASHATLHNRIPYHTHTYVAWAPVSLGGDGMGGGLAKQAIHLFGTPLASAFL